MEQLNFHKGESREDYPNIALFNSARFLIQELSSTSSTHVNSLTLDSQSRQVWGELVVADPAERYESNKSLIQLVNADCQDRAVAPTISFYCSDNSFYRQQVEVMQNNWVKHVLFHNVPTKARFVKDKTRYSFNVVHNPRGNNMVLPYADENPSSDFERPGLMSLFTNTYCANQIHMPSVSTMVASSGKLQILDQLLKQLKAEGHRVLIFSQMTKMLDILEDYMHARNYSFFRLDGQTNVQDRRDMVHTFQTDRKVFAFLLSTRAGGLGINLTSADTVIFYESDWNPTLDAQAMDRVHRIGQTKQVTVYRLVVGGTVEERILKIAQQKNTIQDTVYSGHFKADASEEPSSKDVMSVLLDDLEWDQMQKEKLEKEQAKKSASKAKKKSTKPKKKKPADEDDQGEEKPKKKATAKKRKREGDSEKPEGKKKKKTTKKNE